MAGSIPGLRAVQTDIVSTPTMVAAVAQLAALRYPRAMRFAALRTISARITLGFAVLILTFGGVAVWTIVNMSVVSQDIEIIRIGYLRLALSARDLAENQNQLRSYLTGELQGETREERVRGRLLGYHFARGTHLHDLEEIAGELAVLVDRLDVPNRHPLRVRRIRDDLRDYRRRVDRMAGLYAALLAAPPLESSLGTDAEDPAAAAADRGAAEAALEELHKREFELFAYAHTFARTAEQFVERTAVDLEVKEGKLRRLFIYLGITAVLIGVLVTMWATLTLRPLRRLRTAAQHIARGDYGSRIQEQGPSEVADLARDFNSMGRAIEERERELVRSERLAAIGKMAAMITHEVRNPLSSIGLNTELLEEEMADVSGQAGEEARALCRAIQTEVDRLTDITEEYLQFARLPTPKLAVEQVNDIVRGLIDFEREQVALRGVTLETEFATDLPQVHADDAQIRQALLNLLRNAADAVSEIGGGTVSIKTRCVNDANGESPTVEVEVADDGPGIAEELSAKIFDPFFSTKSGGTGLGLALTHQIVREHGGHMRVDSEPGHGARFIMSLPSLTR